MIDDQSKIKYSSFKFSGTCLTVFPADSHDV